MLKVSSKNRNFTCYVIGEESLVIPCMEILLAHHFKILALVTKNSQLIDWAIKHNIKIITSVAKLEETVAHKVDYLFSIVNSVILSSKLLEKVKKLAINYHDSFLPRYAGVHATSWALINQEKSHGITWHLINDKVDTGDILKQAVIAIDKNETALSLNLKCYQAAIECFNELIGEVVTNTYQLKPQDLRQRTYYAFNQKPTANGWINWNDTAENIERMFRALALGEYPNRLSLLKFVAKNTLYVIDGLKISNKRSGKTPGTILQLTKEKIRIATQTKDIIITQLRAKDGKVYALNCLPEYFKAGEVLYSPSDKLQNTYQKLASELSKQEKYWLETLQQFNSTNLPFLDKEDNKSNKNRSFILAAQFKLPADLQKKLALYFDKRISITTILLAVWLVYLYRIHTQEVISINIFHPDFLKKYNKFANLLAAYVPLNVNLQEKFGFKEIVNLVNNELITIEKQHTFSNDIYARFPQINNAFCEQPIAVHLFDFMKSRQKLTHPINLFITRKSIYFYVNKKILNENLSAFINAIPGHLASVLGKYVFNSTTTLSQFNLLTENEKKKILINWNQTYEKYPRHKTVPQLFQEQVNKMPDKVAIVYHEQSLTYRQLNEKANQLAHYLLEQGAKNGQPIAICITQSIEMMIGLLAIVKLGGIYVPIDPEYPQERINYILHDTKAKILLSNSVTLDKLKCASSYLQKKIVIEETSFSNYSTNNIQPKKLLPTSTIYIMYTSGSSGKPKGVMVSHRNVVNLVGYINRNIVNQDDCVAQASNFAFDASIIEIWGTLLSGARLLLIPKDIMLTSSGLLLFLQKNPVSTLFLTAALFRQTYKQEPEIFNFIEKLLTGGEGLNIELIKSFTKRKDKAPFFLLNMYGPTECTVFSTSYKVNKETIHLPSFPIGQPINNTQCYVLDRFAQPVPPGVTGELYISGDGISNGYLALPEENRKKFIANFFQNKKGDKLYKTGDKVRWLPEGIIEYIGRLDDQIKIRGFRVELGEIEQALLQFPIIFQAKIVVQETDITDKKIIAFLVLNKAYLTDKQSFNSKLIRDSLKQKLPHYMIPNLFYVVDKLPLTQNGKVDREKLIKLTKNSSFFSQCEYHFAPATTLVQENLVKIWQKLFKLDQVSITDDFFALGGDSITAMQLTAEANQQGLQMAIKDIFAYPTLEQLSHHVKPIRNERVENIALSGNVPLTPIQYWFFEKLFAKPEQFSQACLMTLSSEINPEKLMTSLQRLVAYHDVFWLRFSKKNGDWEQYYVPAQQKSIEILQRLDVSKVNGSEINAAIYQLIHQLQACFDLARGPLIKAALIEGAEANSYQLLIVAHHLIIDGYSWRVLLEDLEKLYETNYLAPNTCTFQKWAKALDQYAKDPQIDLSRRSWLSFLQVKDKFTLPLDCQLGLNTEDRADTITSCLTAEETAALTKAVTHKLGVKFDELLIATLVQTIGKWAESSVILLELEGHGREEISSKINLSHVLGWFTSLYPAYFTYDAEMPLTSTLQSIKQQLQGLPAPNIDYGISRYLIKDKQLALEVPISFNYWGQFDHFFSKESRFKFNWLKFVSHSDNLRTHLLNIEAWISEGKLFVSWSYSKNFHRLQTIQSLSENFFTSLRSLVRNALLTHLNNPTNFAGYPISRLETAWKLTPLQKGLLFHSIAQPASGTYLVQVICKLGKNINITLLKQAFQSLLNKHSVLRTCFKWENLIEPVQEAQEESLLAWNEYLWPSLTEEEFNHRLNDFLAADRQAGFNLSQSPLMRVTLLQSGERCQFIWCFHHILLDGWSTFRLLNDLGHIYQNLLRNKSIPGATAFSYYQYIEWLYQQDLPKAEIFWRSYLDKYMTPVELTFFQKQEALQKTTICYQRYTLPLSSFLTQSIQQFCRSHQLTVSTFFQSIWALLLSRYAQQTDIVLGVTVSARPAEIRGIDQAIGLMVNTLPFRIIIDENKTILDYLQAVQTNMLGVLNYAYTPLSHIQTCSKVAASQELFNSVFVYENYPQGTISALGIEQDSIQIIDPTHYPLVVAVVPHEEFKLQFAYNAEQLLPSAIALAAEHFQVLITEFLEKYRQPLKQARWLTKTEFQKIIYQWNPLPQKKSSNQTINQLFEEQVIKTPHQIALVYQNQKLTYLQLNEQANQLARYLLKNSLVFEEKIGLCLERGLNLLIGILGILKAGAAYVPIEPMLPEKRLSYIVKDCKMRILVTTLELYQEKFITNEEIDETITYICLDRDSKLINKELKSNVQRTIDSKNLAYVIYTSGTTGTPKGTLIEHRNVLRLFETTTSLFDFSKKDTWSLFHSTSFDFSVWEIWGALFFGGKLIIVPRAVTQDLNQFYELLIEEEVSILNVTPSVFYKLIPIRRTAKRKLLSLRMIIFGGEALSFQALIPWFEMSNENNPKLINMYGITETTVHVTHYHVSKDVVSLNKGSIIGQPLPDRCIYILDKYLNPVPANVMGELYVGGGGVARGYLNQMNLTQEKFINDPFVTNVKQRLYKTGDLARWLTDGRIEYVGRIDNQVKIRGFRIELGEIQHYLEKHPGVQHAVIVSSGIEAAEKRLIAYIVRKLPDLTAELLRSFANKFLPPYMVPSHYIFINQVPLTVNGKIDYPALPSPAENRDTGNCYTPPESALEEKLLTIWAGLLNIQLIGVEDNFFEIGGHSLSSLEMLSLIQNNLGIELPLHTFMSQPTIRGLAKAIQTYQNNQLTFKAATRRRQKGNLLDSLIPLRPQGEKSPLFLIHPIGGTVFWYISLAKYIDPARPLYGIQDPGIEMKGVIPFKSIGEMASAYIKMIRTVQPHGPYLLAGASAGATISVAMARQLLEQGEAVEFVGLLDGWAPFPDLLRNQELFEANMRRQYNTMQKQFLAKGILHAEVLLELQWRRSQMIAEYKLPVLPNKLTLFKAMDTVSVFQSIEAPLNHWESYSNRPVELHLVPGDHETMFDEPHVAILGQKLSVCLGEIDYSIDLLTNNED